MNVAFLSLGGNLGDRPGYIDKTRRLLETYCGSIVQSSSIYETEAWGSNSKKKYLNQVVKILTRLSPASLLKQTLKIEKELGRKRGDQKNSDRTADIDLLFYEDLVLKNDHLTVPHPRLHLRKFVLVPLNEIAPKLVHPGLGASIENILAKSSDKLMVSPYSKTKEPLYICIEGNIGSGKTTLAKALAAKLKAGLLLEEFEQNHLLPLFYEDPKAYAFALEFSFLIARFEQMKNYFSKARDIVVSDFSIYKCLWFAQANLPPAEFRLFKKHYSALAAHLPAPDLLVNIETSTANLKRNIQKRGRPYELNIGQPYLTALSRSYAKGLAAPNLAPILRLKVKTYHPELEKSAIKTIEKYLKENFGWHD